MPSSVLKTFINLPPGTAVLPPAFLVSAYDSLPREQSLWDGWDQDGDRCLRADMYDVAEGKTYYYNYYFYAQWLPQPLPLGDLR